MHFAVSTHLSSYLLWEFFILNLSDMSQLNFLIHGLNVAHEDS